MVKKLFLFLIIIYSSQLLVSAQTKIKPMSPVEYVDRYKIDAIEEMLRTGIPASITLAQGILESSSGNSKLAQSANNHFGIKCHSNWTGGTFYMDDDRRNECFRKYPTVYDSYKDHSQFLVSRKRYANLFELNPKNYKGWARGLKRDGYATNPKYPRLLIDIIQRYNLDQYDKISKKEAQRLAKLSDNEIDSKKGQQVITNKQDEPVRKSNQVNIFLKKYNGVKYTVARKDDNFEDIAKRFDLRLGQIYRYNDMNRTSKLEPGQVIYVQPKRRRGRKKSYIVKEGDTMWEISQLFAVKLKQLYKKNNMILGTEPEVGQVLSLKSRIRR